LFYCSVLSHSISIYISNMRIILWKQNKNT
jgi:hypothetical protein